MVNCWLLDGPGLCDRNGNDLTFAANAHLFEWPGELVAGDGVVSTTDLDVPFRDEGYRQWKNKRARHEPQQIPVSQVAGDPGDFGVIQRLRQVAMEMPEAQPVYGFSRPNRAAAFSAAQQLPAVENPWVKKLESFSVGLLKTDEPGCDEPRCPDLSGAVWLLNSIAEEMLSVEIFSLDLIELIGPTGGAQALKLVLSNQGIQASEFNRIMQRYQSWITPKAIQKIESRILRVKEEIRNWLDAGSKAVRMPDGQIDDELSLVNALMALHGAHRLTEIGEQMTAFPFFMTAALNSLMPQGG